MSNLDSSLQCAVEFALVTYFVFAINVQYCKRDLTMWVRCSMSPNTLRVHTDSLAEIVEVEIEVVSPSIVPSGSFTELKSHCHLYGAQGQRQAYLLPMPRLRGPRSDYVRQICSIGDKSGDQAGQGWVVIVWRLACDTLAV
ncbi:hypothetical protein TNCV_2232911 [Trichonephila clavipes]|nr:hypothetical protein TNCV_2232911 [Trichonephila clavipes]